MDLFSFHGLQWLKLYLKSVNEARYMSAIGPQSYGLLDMVISDAATIDSIDLVSRTIDTIMPLCRLVTICMPSPLAADKLTPNKYKWQTCYHDLSQGFGSYKQTSIVNCYKFLLTVFLKLRALTQA